MKKISIFGIVVGVVLLLAYLALLLGFTATESPVQGISREITEKLSLDSLAIAGMALSAVVVLVSLLRKPRVRAVGFVALACANITVGTAVLGIYITKNMESYFPYGACGLGSFTGISMIMLGIKMSWEVLLASVVSPLALGVVVAGLLAGTLHACTKAKDDAFLKTLAGLLGLIILIFIICGTFMSLQFAQLGDGCKMSRDLPQREQALGIYAGLFVLATLVVLVLSMLMPFLRTSAQRCSKIALALLWGMAISLPLVWLGLITWSGLSEHAYHAENWLVLGKFTLINGILSILPIILLVSGVSLALREFSVSQRGGQEFIPTKEGLRSPDLSGSPSATSFLSRFLSSESVSGNTGDEGKRSGL